MKFSSIFILLLVFTGCNSKIAGTLGRFDEREFNIPKEIIVKSIETFFSQNPEYKVPNEWKKYDHWSESGYDFLDSRIFYFNTGQKEMYYVTFLANGEPNQDEKGSTILAVRAVNFGDHRWYIEEDVSGEKREIIEGRFEREIIKKIEKISGVKSTRTK